MRDQFIVEQSVFRVLRGFGEHILKHTLGVAITMLVLMLWLAQLSLLYAR